MKQFHIVRRTERLIGAGLAIVLTTVILCSALWPFAKDGETPWFADGTAADSPLRRCDGRQRATERHQCLRDVAAAEKAKPAPDTRLAGR